MSGPRNRFARSRFAPWLIVALFLANGAGILNVARDAQLVAPQPPPQAAGTYAPSDVIGSPQQAGATPGGPSAHASASQHTTSKATGPVLPASIPTRLRVPAIGVNASLIKLGLNSDHTVQVPPLTAHSVPGWYRYSPTPGQIGPAVILGHIDSAAYGPGVFFKLGALRKGDTIDVTRADHRIAVFKVNAVAEYSKQHFPTLTVYGSTDNAALRLITCGGSFDSSIGSYRDNIVVFASLVGSHRAPDRRT